MIVALYGVALAMIVGGLAAVVEGYGIIVLERGWTFVIAGSVCASSGAVLLGIAYAASRLARLQGEIARLSERSPRAEPAFPSPPPGLAGPASTTLPAALANPTSIPPSSEVANPAASEGLLAGGGGTAAALGTAGAALSGLVAGGGSAAADLSPPTTLKAPDARPDVAVAPKEETSPSQARMPSDAGLLAGNLEPEAGEHADQASDQGSELIPPGLIVPEAPVVDKPAPGDETLFGPEVGQGEEETDRDDLFEPETQAPDHGHLEPSDIDRDEEESPSVPVADQDLEELTAEDAAAEPEAKEDESSSEAPLAVVGTYTSGGTRYVMFSDGSIEAETPNGTFQFSSLEELKAFIASGEGEAR